MGWFKKAFKKIKKAVKKVGKVVKKVGKIVPIGKLAKNVIGSIPVIGGIAKTAIDIGEKVAGNIGRSKNKKKGKAVANYFGMQAKLALNKAAKDVGVSSSIKNAAEPTTNPLTSDNSYSSDEVQQYPEGSVKATTKSNSTPLILGGLAIGGLFLSGALD